MKKISTILLACVLSLPLCAQVFQTKKVAILEVVDREGTIGYGVKLQLRASLTSAITQTPGYEGYDRVDMAAIFGEHDFQRTGAVSDEQIKRLGEMSGCDYVLIAEAAVIDASNIVLVAKVVNVTTGRVEMSADIMIATNANGIRKGGQQLASQLFTPKTTTFVQETTTGKSQAAVLAEQEAERARRQAEWDAERLRKQAEAEALAIAKAEENARIAAEKEAEKARRQAEWDAERLRKQAEAEALAIARAEERERIAAEKEAEKARKQAEAEAEAKAKADEKARIAAEKEAERLRKQAEKEWRLAHPYRSQKVKVLVSVGVPWADDGDIPFFGGDVVVGWQKTPHWFLGVGVGLTPFGYEEEWSEGDYCDVNGFTYPDRWYDSSKGEYVETNFCENYVSYGHCWGHNRVYMSEFVGGQHIPVYFNARLYWFRSKFSPYLNAKVGTTYSLNEKKLGGVYLSPSLGIAIGRFSVAVSPQFLLSNYSMLDSDGVISPEGDFYGTIGFAAEWAF